MAVDVKPKGPAQSQPKADVPNTQTPDVPAVASDAPPAWTGTGKEPTHWVVLHQRVARFEQGQVIPRAQWPVGTSFNDLMRLGAVRPADDSEITEGFADLNPDETKEAREKSDQVYQTRIDLLEKELAFYKDENHKSQLMNRVPAGNVQPSEGVAKLIKAKDDAIKDLSQKLTDAEAARAALAGENDQLKQALDAATKPAAQPTGGDKK